MNDVLSKRLKDLRKERGKTQQQIAEMLNVLRSTYGEYERGKIATPMDKLQALAAYFDVSIDYLIGNTNVKRPRYETPTEDVSESDRKQIRHNLKRLFVHDVLLTVN